MCLVHAIAEDVTCGAIPTCDVVFSSCNQREDQLTAAGELYKLDTTGVVACCEHQLSEIERAFSVAALSFWQSNQIKMSRCHLNQKYTTVSESDDDDSGGFDIDTGLVRC